MKTVILISGPPGTGKDTVSDIIARQYPTWSPVQEKFALPLIAAAQVMGFDMSESVKDMVDPYLRVTRRNFQIAFSEDLCKPRMGERVFGEALAARTMSKSDGLVIVSDSGFLPEAEAVVDSVGVENVVRLHLSRPGHDYSRDSRNDWPCPVGMRRYDIENDGNTETLVSKVLAFCREVIDD